MLVLPGIGLGLALVLTTTAAAQSGTPSEGQLVAALQNQLVVRGDGAIYLVKDGARHLITPAVTTDDEIATIPEGDPYMSGLAPLDGTPPTTANGQAAATTQGGGLPPSILSPGPAVTTTTASLPSSVHVSLNEWSISPDATTLAAGKVTFDVTDTGKQQHEMIVFKSDKDPTSFPVSRNRVDESAVGSKIGEVEDLRAGDNKSATYDLKPGTYILLCNLSNHYTHGMVTQIEVK